MVVSEMLGHSSIAMTLDTYSHVLPHMQSQAAATMDEALDHPELGDVPNEARCVSEAYGDDGTPAASSSLGDASSQRPFLHSAPVKWAQRTSVRGGAQRSTYRTASC
jgi:hypothetical protein